jgi:hypothetical protein
MELADKIKTAIRSALLVAKDPKDLKEIQRILQFRDGYFLKDEVVKPLLESVLEEQK